MVCLSITGQMKVSTLQEGFLKEFGLTLRVYDGRAFADPTQTLAQVSKKKGSGKDLSVAKNMKVGNLEDKFEEEFGLKVQVAGSDDSYLCDDNLTLNAAQQEDEKKAGRKERKAERQEAAGDAVMNKEGNGQRVLVLTDLYQRIEDAGVSEFDELDGDGQASLIRDMANDFMTQVGEQLEIDNEVHLLGLSGSDVTYLTQETLNEVTSENTENFFDDGFIQFAVTNVSIDDWASNLANISGGLDCLITAIGKHPDYDGIIKQGYGFGEMEEGLISDEDEDEFLNSEVWVNQYQTYFGK